MTARDISHDINPTERVAGQPRGAPLIAFEHGGKLLTERLPDAAHEDAPQAPHGHHDGHASGIDRDVGHDTMLVGMHPACRGAARRAFSRPARGPRSYPDPRALIGHIVDDERHKSGTQCS